MSIDYSKLVPGQSISERSYVLDADAVARYVAAVGDRTWPVTATDGGLDVAVDTASALDLAMRERLAEFAANEDLARLTWAGEPVVQRRSPRAVFAGIAVDLPLGAFLQPTKMGEAAMAEIVVAALDPTATVADLFAGCGALSLPLAMAASPSMTAEALLLTTRADSAPVIWHRRDRI